MSFNYIKAHRRQWGLSQKELGFLLGYESNSNISKIENGKCSPLLSDVINLELLFEKPASRLFPDHYSEMSVDLLERLELFEQLLCESDTTPDVLDKLDTIRKVRASIGRDNSNRI